MIKIIIRPKQFCAYNYIRSTLFSLIWLRACCIKAFFPRERYDTFSCKRSVFFSSCKHFENVRHVIKLTQSWLKIYFCIFDYGTPNIFMFINTIFENLSNMSKLPLHSGYHPYSDWFCLSSDSSILSSSLSQVPSGCK